MSDDCLVDRLAAELLEAEIGKPSRHAEEFRHVVRPDAFGGVLPYESRRPREKVRGRGGRYRRLSFNDLDRPYQKRRGGNAAVGCSSMWADTMAGDYYCSNLLWQSGLTLLVLGIRGSRSP